MSGKALVIHVCGQLKNKLRNWYESVRNVDPNIASLEPGLVIEDHRFDSRVLAERYIESHHVAGQPALAVSFYVGNKDSGEAVRLRSQLTALGKQIITLTKNSYDSLIGGKSRHVGCRGCKSRLTRSYMKDVFCPVCQYPLMSLQRVRRLQDLRHREVETTKLLLQAGKVTDKSGPLLWLVGGWCLEKKDDHEI